MSDWNSLWESYVSVLLLLISTLLALDMKRRFTGSLTVFDAFIPVSFLSIACYENIIIVQNVSHGVLPLFVVISSAYLVAFGRDGYRMAFLPFLAVIGMYTGFAMFATSLTLPYLLWRSLTSSERRLRVGYASAFLAALAGSATFFIGYESRPAVACFEFPHPRPFEYFDYMNGLIKRVLGVSLVKSALSIEGGSLGILPFFLYILSCFVAVRRVLYDRVRRQENLSILYMLFFSLLFWMFTSVGRVCLGEGSSQAPRYILYGLPGFLAVFIMLSQGAGAGTWKRALPFAFLVWFIVREVSSEWALKPSLRAYRDGKKAWIECFKKGGSVGDCNEIIRICSKGLEPRVSEILGRMKEEGLHIFKGTD